MPSMKLVSGHAEHEFDIDLSWPVGMTAEAACKLIGVQVQAGMTPALKVKMEENFRTIERPLDPRLTFRAQGVRPWDTLVLILSLGWTA